MDCLFTVTSVTPVDGASDIETGSTVTITFSRTVSAASVTNASVTVGTAAGDRSVSGSIVTFTPTDPLEEGTSYTVTVNGVTDADGVGLASAFTSSFTTRSFPVMADAGADYDVSFGDDVTLEPAENPGTGATVTWESEDPSIVSVDAEGLVTALSEGTTSVRAQFRGVMDEATVIVVPAPEISFSVDSATFAAAVATLGPDPIVVRIESAVGGVLDNLSASIIYEPGGPEGWLQVALESTLAPTDLTITADISSLAVGTYSATISVSSPADPDSPRFLPITLTIAGLTVAETGGGTQVNESGTTRPCA